MCSITFSWFWFYREYFLTSFDFFMHLINIKYEWICYFPHLRGIVFELYFFNKYSWIIFWDHQSNLGRILFFWVTLYFFLKDLSVLKSEAFILSWNLHLYKTMFLYSPSCICKLYLIVFASLPYYWDREFAITKLYRQFTQQVKRYFQTDCYILGFSIFIIFLY